jgi:hypothetical protein
LVHDQGGRRVTVYLLDSQAASAVPIPEPHLTLSFVIDGRSAQFRLPASHLPGEPDGHSSCFAVQNDALSSALQQPASQPRFMVPIGGKFYRGRI